MKMSISDQYTDFLFNYLTVMENVHITLIDQNQFSQSKHILKISNVYFSDQIEFKINKNKLLEITQRFFIQIKKFNVYF